MSEIAEEKISGLEQRVEQIEIKLDTMDGKLDKIQLGLFGDDSIKYLGVIKEQESIRDDMAEIESRISAMEIAKNTQAATDRTKIDVTDNIVQWGKRVFWIISSIIVLILLITGKIGIADLL